MRLVTLTISAFFLRHISTFPICAPNILYIHFWVFDHTCSFQQPLPLALESPFSVISVALNGLSDFMNRHDIA